MWISTYRSGLPNHNPVLDEIVLHADEYMSSLVLSLAMGKTWVVAEIEPGRILFRQKPTHDAWEWEFKRQDA